MAPTKVPIQDPSPKMLTVAHIAALRTREHPSKRGSGSVLTSQAAVANP